MSIDFIKHCGHVMMHYANTHHTTRLALAGGGLCAFVTAELAMRTLKNVWQIVSNDEARYAPDFKQKFAINLCGTILAGICAANVVSGLAFLGAIVLIANGFFGMNSEDPLLITKAIHLVAPTCWGHLGGRCTCSSAYSRGYGSPD